MGITALIVKRHEKRLANYRSPLTSNLLRSPGESLAKVLGDIQEKMDTYLVFLFILPSFFLATCVPMVYEKQALAAIIVMVFGLIPGMAFILKKLSKLLNTRHQFEVGFDAEKAVGQELNMLMPQGCYVYHDVPGESFNIDHVVVGPAGVFAVETKGRSKVKRNQGAADAKVVFDGQQLIFPTWAETDPLDQSRRQAKWLTRYLSSACGFEVADRPALAIAGWFIERQQPSDVLIFNGKPPRFMAVPENGNRLSGQEIMAIKHQVEQRCRDSKPLAYRKEEEPPGQKYEY